MGSPTRAAGLHPCWRRVASDVLHGRRGQRVRLPALARQRLKAGERAPIPASCVRGAGNSASGVTTFAVASQPTSAYARGRWLAAWPVAAASVRGRPFRVTLAIVAAIVVAGGIATAYAASRYQPLSYGTSSGCCADDPSPVRSTLFVGGELRIEGRLDVWVRSIDPPRGFEVRLDLRRAPGEEINDRGVRPFRPFKLEAGGWRWIALHARLPGCSRMPKTTTVSRDITVEYEVASGVFERTVWLDIDGAVGTGTLNGRRCVFLVSMS